MNKPITIARQELIDALIQVINNSPVPAFVAADVLKELLPAVQANIKKELEADVAEYRYALQTEAEAQALAETEKEVVEDKESSDNDKKGGKKGGKK